MSDSNQGFITRRGREGSRWHNQRPTGQEVSEWFSGVRLHDGMEHADYVAGIALIEQTDEVPTIVAYRGDGTPEITRTTEMSFTPYPRVEARIAYFWKLCELRGWKGSIAPVNTLGDGAAGLPEGFFRLRVTDAAGKDAPLVGRTMKVAINDPKGDPVGWYPSETKVVPMLRNGLVDADALAKASTGAIGRALGAAGMLILPGTGVATAEDMLALARGEGVALGLVPQTEQPTGVVIPPEKHREILVGYLNQLAGTDKQEELHEWWGMRHFPEVAKLTDEQVPVAIIKAEALLDIATVVG